MRRIIRKGGLRHQTGQGNDNDDVCNSLYHNFAHFRVCHSIVLCLNSRLLCTQARHMPTATLRTPPACLKTSDIFPKLDTCQSQPCDLFSSQK
jgi:hypothetical protein